MILLKGSSLRGTKQSQTILSMRLLREGTLAMTRKHALTN
jgi:hypothetical protein